MRYAKRISIMVLVGLLSVGSICGSYTQGVYAFEWVGGAIGFTEALSWLLASIGVTCAITDYANTIDGSRDAFWERYEDEMTTYMQDSGITYPTISEWKEKLQRGILDKGSACWDAFKEWVSGLISGSNSGDSTLGSSAPASNVASEMARIAGISGWNFVSNNITVYSGLYIYNLNSGMAYPSNAPNPYLYIYEGSYMFKPDSSGYFKVYKDGSRFDSNVIIRKSNSYNSVTLGYGSFNTAFSDLSNYGLILFNMNYDFPDSTKKPGVIISIGASASSDFDGLDGVDVDNLDIISSDIPDEEDSEVALPMPGVSTSDDAASASAYDDIVDAINDGTISLDDGITRIQELLRVIVYDTTNDDVIPVVEDPDSGEPVKKDDVIQDNKNNMGFTLAGLENVFPFCIPWDLYAFINILRADPVAPVFILPFPNPSDLDHPYQVRVDLSSWNDAMAIFRLAEDFLFIIGLAILTRSLIGAGGGDG